jgi:hypothetical protein
MPIYEASGSIPKVFAIALHSGVTLAFLHASKLVDWIVDGHEPAGFHKFHSGRYMFKRLDYLDEPSVSITVENRQITVPASDSVAAAMLSAGMVTARTTPVSGARRSPYCMMGTCFECLVGIDGVSNQQACQTQVREGMIERLCVAVRR